MPRIPERWLVGFEVFVATRPAEWPRIMAFAMMTALRDIPFIGRVVPAEIWLKLRGAWFLVGTARSELGGFLESCVLKKYEPDARFAPQPKSTVADIGANVGFFAIMQARRDVLVLAVEPHPDAYRRLEASVGRNGLKDRIMLFNCALTRQAGVAPFAMDGRHTTTGKLTHSPAFLARTVPVETRTLDDVVRAAAVRAIGLLKMDVEGAECDVLDGGEVVLGICKRIVLEYHGSAQLSGVRRRLAVRGFEEVFLSKTHVAFGRS